MPNSTPPIYIDLKEAAKMSDRTVKTIRNWIKAGKLETIKEDPKNSSAKLLINKEDLQALLATKVKSDPPRKKKVVIPPEIKETSNLTLMIELEKTRGELKVAKCETSYLKERVMELESLNKHLETLQNSMKNQMEILRENLQAAEIQWQHAATAYNQEVQNGFWQRYFNAKPKTNVKLITGPAPKLPGPTSESK